MQHRITLSTNLLIVLAANKRRKAAAGSMPKVKGIKVTCNKVHDNCSKLKEGLCKKKVITIEPMLAMA